MSAAAAVAPAAPAAPRRRFALSRGQRVLIVVFVLTLPLVTPRVRGADEIEYFSYLRSAVFDGDLDFENEYTHFYARDPQGLAGFRATFLDRREEETGRPINFAPAGAAILWAPFYLLAHAAVRAGNGLGAAWNADGFSLPYTAAVCFASALYAFAGLMITQALLVRRAGVGQTAATLAVLGVWLGTPLLYYMSLAPAFAHAASSFVAALLVWLFLRARDADVAGRGLALGGWALVGAASGLAALVREQDLLLLVIPGGWLLLQTRRRPVTSLLRGAVMAAAAALAFSPQLFAYRAINGRFAPSRLVGRKMSYGSPHFLEVLFDPAHGLFFWSPLLLLAVAGLVLALLRPRSTPRLLTALLGLALLAQAWINGCIESWSVAGAFGARRFVGVTLVFAWGLAVLLARSLPQLGTRGAAAVVAVFAWWNVSLMVQFGLRLMDRQRLEWPRVAVNQFTEVPPRLLRVAGLFFTDRERLVRESR